MKKFIKYFAVLFVLLFSLTSCGNNNGSNIELPEGTVEEKYAYVFEKAVDAGKGTNEIMADLKAAKIHSYPLKDSEIRAGYVNGYNYKKVTGYTELASVEPKKVSTTYAMHVLKSDDPEALVTLMKAEYADNTWGCNSAQVSRNQFYTTKGNYVLAVIYPVA